MELLDSKKNPLVVGKRYIIELKDDKLVQQLTQSHPNSLVTIFGHNEIVTFLNLYIVEGDTPTGTFEMKD